MRLDCTGNANHNPKFKISLMSFTEFIQLNKYTNLHHKFTHPSYHQMFAPKNLDGVLFSSAYTSVEVLVLRVNVKGQLEP